MNRRASATREATPIHRLPCEVLCPVFRNCLSDHYWSAPSQCPALAIRRMLTLTSVCAFWRDVLLNEPMFWTAIPLEHTIRILELYLLRSGMVPLDIFLAEPVVPDHWRDSVLLLTPHAERIRSLDLRLKSAIASEGSWYYATSLLDTPMLALTSLRLDGRDLDVFSLLPLDLGLFPKLHSLVLHEVGVQWDPPQMTELTDLTMEGLLWQQQPTLDELLSLLAATPNLRTFAFRESGFLIYCDYRRNADSLPPREIVDLPGMASLSFSMSEHALRHVLRHLRIPESATIEGHEADLG